MELTGVSLDSRSLAPGDLYAALPGQHVHGAKFVASAVAAGALAVLTDPVGAEFLSARSTDSAEAGAASGAANPPIIVVADPRSHLGDLAAHLYGSAHAAPRMLGITGTNGKTTTAYLLEAALRGLGHHTGLVGTVETRIGDSRLASVRTTPEATDLHALLGVMSEAEVTDCVMEVSSHALSQHRVDGVVYDVALFTNLSQDHLDFHDSLEDYFAAKASLFTPERARRAVICVDDEWGQRLAAQTTLPTITLSTSGEVPAHFAITQADGDEFTLSGQLPGEDPITLRLVSHLPGTFNVSNTAMAALALVALGEDPARVAAAMATPPHVPGRMEVVAPPGEGVSHTGSESDSLVGQAFPRVIVDYAHTPDAVLAALTALRPSTAGSLIAVVGAGGDRDKGKRAAMGRAAGDHADVVVVTDDNPRTEDPTAIRAAVLAGLADSADTAEAVEVADRGEAIAAAINRAYAAGAGTSTVVILGKGHETGQEINGEVLHFSDREQAERCLAEHSTEPARGDR